MVHQKNRLICDQSNSSALSMHQYLCNSGSLIQIQISPKERTKIVVISSLFITKKPVLLFARVSGANDKNYVIFSNY